MALPFLEPDNHLSYRVPTPLDLNGKPNTNQILGWQSEALEEGMAYLRGHSAYEEIDRAMEFITGLTPEKLPKNLSRIKINHAKHDLREMAEILSNLRPSWTFECTNEQFRRQATISKKLHEGWYQAVAADRRIHDALLWAGVAGTGYLSPYWNPDFHRDTGLGDIDLKVLGPKQCMFVQIPRSGDIQGSYNGIIHETLTLHEALCRWPHKSHEIAPSRSLKSGLGTRVMDQARTVLGFVLGEGGRKNRSPDLTPVVDVYYHYIDDRRINDSGRPIAMGQPGSTWYYEVPSYGSDIPNGKLANGTQLYRKADEMESRLYPGRRLIIATDTCVLYDGPSYWWHGRIPLVKFSLINWPWEPLLGHGLLRDTWSIQTSLNSIYRALDDKANASIRPALMIDENRVGKPEAEKFDPRQPGQKLYGDTSQGELAKPILSAEYYAVQQWVVEWLIPYYREQIKENTGLPGLRDLASLKQLPASESLDKLAELASPIATGMSRTMEVPVKELGDMTNSLRYQFYTLKRRLKILGQDGITEEDYDFEPATMIPSHMPEEVPEDGPSRYSIYQRGRWFSSQVWMHVTPLSLHQITQTSRKLLYLQLWRGQFPIDPQTVAEALDFADWGKIEGDTIQERWKRWQFVQLQIQMAMQQLASGMAPQQPPMGGEAGGEAGPAGAGQANKPNGGMPGSPSQQGRPPTAQSPPHMEVKSDMRSTIAES